MLARKLLLCVRVLAFEHYLLPIFTATKGHAVARLGQPPLSLECRRQETNTSLVGAHHFTQS